MFERPGKRLVTGVSYQATSWMRIIALHLVGIHMHQDITGKTENFLGKVVVMVMVVVEEGGGGLVSTGYFNHISSTELHSCCVHET